MRANLIYHDNGVGLSADADIVEGRLIALGCEVVRSECHDHLPPQVPCDFNLHLELFDPWWLAQAPLTYLIPNQEWLCVEHLPAIATIDGILCKTHYAVDAMRSYSTRASYIGFTSRDRYSPGVRKDFGRWLHLAGKSGQKSTPIVIETWRANPDFPTLTVLHHPENQSVNRISFDGVANVVRITDYVSDSELVEIMNGHEVHVCPSEMEGFGHSLNEALACKALVVTTDAPPMNELVTPRSGIPVPWDETSSDPLYPDLTRRYRVTAARLAAVVRQVMSLSGTARAQIGERARLEYLERDRSFGQAFDAFFLARLKGGNGH